MNLQVAGIVALALSVASVPALAFGPGSYQIAANEERARYVNPDQVRLVDGRVFAWVSENLREQTAGVQSIRTRFEFDCTLERHRALATYMYELPSGRGEVVTRFNDEGEWTYPPPNTFAEQTMYVVCAFARDESPYRPGGLIITYDELQIFRKPGETPVAWWLEERFFPD